MIWTKPIGFFEAKPINSPWLAQKAIAEAPKAAVEPSWRDDAEKKKRFAAELSNHSTPFAAACAVFGADTQAALWASIHWVSDPVVTGAREIAANDLKILDKNALCHKLLKISDEKSPQGYYVVEPKDRIACLKLYAEIQGFIGKVENNATFNNFANNNLKVVFVKPDNDHHKLKTINNELDEVQELEQDNLEIIDSSNTTFKPLPKLKIV